MITRRSLIKGLLGAIFAGDLLKELGAQAIKAITAPESAPEAPTTVLRLNPAWRTAPNEVSFICAAESLRLTRNLANKLAAASPWSLDPDPKRYTFKPHDSE